MKSLRVLPVLLALALPGLTGCGLLYHGLLGVDTTPRWQSDKKVQRRFKRHDIPESQRFVMDTGSLDEALSGLYRDQVDSTARAADSVAWATSFQQYKDYRQPVHIRYFDAAGQPMFHLVNCYVDKFFPTDWNVEGCLNTFPPQPISYLQDRPVQQSLPFFLEHLSTPSGEPVTLDSLPAADHYAIVIWNSMMYRPSRQLIKQIRAYDAQHAEQNTYFLFVNNHNQFIWSLIGPEDRAKLLAKAKS